MVQDGPTGRKVQVVQQGRTGRKVRVVQQGPMAQGRAGPGPGWFGLVRTTQWVGRAGGFGRVDGFGPITGSGRLGGLGRAAGPNGPVGRSNHQPWTGRRA
ncbi:hypothetical protein GCM10027072_16140 [Streptomyces bullii]